MPQLTGPVVDEVGLLTRRERDDLETAIQQLNQANVAQIQIAILESLHDVPIEEASIKIVDKWQLGGKGRDNGILFLIVPAAHKMRLEVGRGLEGIIPDAIAKRIVQDDVSPLFKAAHYYEGLVIGLGRIAELAKLEFTPQTKISKAKNDRTIMFILILLWLLFMIPFRHSRRFGWLGGLGGGLGGGGLGGGGWSGGGGSFGGGGASGDW